MTRRCPAHERNTSADKLDRYRIPSADLLAHYHPGERLLDIFEQHPPERTGSVTRLEAERRKLLAGIFGELQRIAHRSSPFRNPPELNIDYALHVVERKRIEYHDIVYAIDELRSEGILPTHSDSHRRRSVPPGCKVRAHRSL